MILHNKYGLLQHIVQSGTCEMRKSLFRVFCIPLMTNIRQRKTLKGWTEVPTIKGTHKFHSSTPVSETVLVSHVNSQTSGG